MVVNFYRLAAQLTPPFPFIENWDIYLLYLMLCVCQSENILVKQNNNKKIENGVAPSRGFNVRSVLSLELTL